MPTCIPSTCPRGSSELEKALEGSAARVIEGMARTEHRYDTAIQLLKEAYGDNKFWMEKLMDD
jgi:Protein of unknown function (DUF1759)